MEAKVRRKLRFRYPGTKLTKESLKKICSLPKSFCGTCSLREGSAVMIAVIQVVMCATLTASLLMLLKFPEKVETWWEGKLKTDFKPSFGKEYKNYARSFMHVWRSVAWALVGICSSYAFCGLGVILALLCKRLSLLWYAPWLSYTMLLLVASYIFIFLEMAFVIIFTTQREVTITQEVMPIILTMMVAGTWTYGFLIVVSHVKKRYGAAKAAKLAKQELVLRRKILKSQVF